MPKTVMTNTTARDEIRTRVLHTAVGRANHCPCDIGGLLRYVNGTADHNKGNPGLSEVPQFCSLSVFVAPSPADISGIVARTLLVGRQEEHLACKN